MYRCYCNYNNINWLFGMGLFFNALGSMLSPYRERRISYLPLFSYNNYPNYRREQTTSCNLLGNTLLNISDTPVFASLSISSGIPFPDTRKSDYNLLGTTLTSLVGKTSLETGQTDYNLLGTTLTSLVGKTQTYSPVNQPLLGGSTGLANTSLSAKPTAASNSVLETPSKSTATQPVKISSSVAVSTHIPTASNTVTNTTSVSNDVSDLTIGNDSSIKRTAGKVNPSTDIKNRVKQIAQKINCEYEDLMGLIFCESSFRTVPKNWNGKSAIGLIQFTQICIDDLNACYGLNLTKQKIAKMSALEQLDIAEKSLLRAKQVAGFSSTHKLTASELYAINYVPANAKRKDYVARKGDGLYEGNSGLDLNGDEKISHSELAAKIKKGRLSVVC